MKITMFSQQGGIVIISNQFLYHLDARCPAIFGNVFLESQKAIPARRRVPSGFPGMNDAHQSIVVRVAAAVEPIVIPLYLLIDLSQKFKIMAARKDKIRGNSKQGRLRNRASLRLAPEPATI